MHWLFMALGGGVLLGGIGVKQAGDGVNNAGNGALKIALGTGALYFGYQQMKKG